MIYILLPVHNRSAITRKFIDCLRQQTETGFHLVLIDDGSTDGTADMACRNLPADSISVIRGNGNWWWAGSLNKGIEWLQSRSISPDDIVLISNDDISFAADFLQRGKDELMAASKTLLLARFWDETTGAPKETGIRFDFESLDISVAGTPNDISCLSTRGLFVRWSDLQRIGKFRPKLLPHYLSDYEFTIRARRKGLGLSTASSVYIVPELEQTGFHTNVDGGFWKGLKRLFSKKTPINPYYWTVFLILCCPVRYWPINLFRVWRNGLAYVLGPMRHSR